MTEKELRARIGKNVRKEREVQNISIDELATQIGKSPEYLTSIENGDEYLSLYNLLKPANIFDIPSHKLVTEVKTDSQSGEEHLREVMFHLVDDSMERRELRHMITFL